MQTQPLPEGKAPFPPLPILAQAIFWGSFFRFIFSRADDKATGIKPTPDGMAVDWLSTDQGSKLRNSTNHEAERNLRQPHAHSPLAGLL